MTPTSNPIIGVLLSTRNHRCLSAPDLTVEKRLPFSSLSALASLHKPERSISPESNDNISEELNHFKPIVCSPCTPPKSEKTTMLGGIGGRRRRGHQRMQ